jgi:hypothetical protein
MPREQTHDDHKQVGRRFDGSWTFTGSIIVGLAILIVGVLLTIYLGGIYSLVFGVPLVIIGLLTPIVIEFFVAEKRD